MHLKKIALTNYRGLEKVTITDAASVNVIVGPNAVGKTTIMEAFRVAKGVLLQRYAN